jgi:heparin binding hemagglutinin HbhA
MTITKSKPFYAVAGAGDFAVKALREVPNKLAQLRVDPKDISSTITLVQAEAKTIPYRAQNVAVVLVGETVGLADAVYGDLVVRGRRISNRIRRQKSTQEVKASASTTVRRTKATKTSAKKSAGSTRTAVRGATTTAKKRAASTTKTARSATKSAASTTAAAVDATTDAAQKIGE